MFVAHGACQYWWFCARLWYLFLWQSCTKPYNFAICSMQNFIYLYIKQLSWYTMLCYTFITGVLYDLFMICWRTSANCCMAIPNTWDIWQFWTWIFNMIVHNIHLIFFSTHWGRDKLVTIFHTTFSNGFLWMKMHEFRLKFPWSLFLGVQLTIFHHWFR